eukprot:gene4352-4665_t
MKAIVIVVVFLVCLFQSSIVSGFQLKTNALRMSFNVDEAARTLSRNKILTKTAQLGLLTKLEKAGFTLSSAVPLLKFADENDLIGVLESSSDKVLPLLAKGIELSPKLLPLAATALKTPPSVLSAGAVGSLGAAVFLNYVIPDTSVGNIALETLITIPFGILLPGGLAVGSAVLSKLK